MEIIIATTSIFGITGLAWLLNYLLGRHIMCPICAGVSGTWLWMLIGMYVVLLPTTNYQLLTALLMGGSVVGIAYQLEKKLLAQKTIFIPVGFVAAYSILAQWWIVFLFAFTLFFCLMLIAIASPRITAVPPHKTNRDELIKKMEDCC